MKKEFVRSMAAAFDLNARQESPRGSALRRHPRRFAKKD
jgi:hypothetical protein